LSDGKRGKASRERNDRSADSARELLLVGTGVDPPLWQLLMPHNNHNHHDPSHPPTPLHRLNVALERFSHHATAWTGSTWAFSLAVGIILVWAISGPLFHFSDTWQLVINTGTTIVTFLMVFLIQRTQNKDSLALQVKLNELLASQKGASNELINVEDWDEEDIIALHKRFTQLTQRLEQCADDCESHSIAEAREALDEAEESLTAAEERKRNR
jgi:low affinity Fe/Cu permease